MLICPSHADLFRIRFDASHKVRMAPKEKKIVKKKNNFHNTMFAFLSLGHGCNELAKRH